MTALLSCSGFCSIQTKSRTEHHSGVYTDPLFCTYVKLNNGVATTSVSRNPYNSNSQ